MISSKIRLIIYRSQWLIRYSVASFNTSTSWFFFRLVGPWWTGLTLESVGDALENDLRTCIGLKASKGPLGNASKFSKEICQTLYALAQNLKSLANAEPNGSVILGRMHSGHDCARMGGRLNLWGPKCNPQLVEGSLVPFLLNYCPPFS